MREISAEALRSLATDISIELQALRRLATDIAAVQVEIEQDPIHAWLFYENLALKLHNFYTGCERIFRTVATELDGSMPEGFDWHRRLLERMGTAGEDRPALLAAETVRELREFLAFRHVVRNIYGFELDVTRVKHLVLRYPAVWQHVEADVLQFIAWLTTLAKGMASD